MLSCTKTYFDVPFAHRQYLHDGRCSFIHGHNWDISVGFSCSELDENGFVVDFGKLKFLKEWIDANLDHACVFSEGDPLVEKLVGAAPEAWKIYIVEQCSCEGIARHLYGVFDALVRKNTNSRAWVSSVRVWEDKKNAALYAPSQSVES